MGSGHDPGPIAHDAALAPSGRGLEEADGGQDVGTDADGQDAFVYIELGRVVRRAVGRIDARLGSTQVIEDARDLLLEIAEVLGHGGRGRGGG